MQVLIHPGIAAGKTINTTKPDRQVTVWRGGHREDQEGVEDL